MKNNRNLAWISCLYGLAWLHQVRTISILPVVTFITVYNMNLIPTSSWHATTT